MTVVGVVVVVVVGSEVEEDLGIFGTYKEN